MRETVCNEGCRARRWRIEGVKEVWELGLAYVLGCAGSPRHVV